MENVMGHDLSRNAEGEVEMMYVGVMPWHKLGTRLEVPPATAEEAIRAAHLDWRVEKKQLYIGEKQWPLEGEFAVVRLDRWERNEDGAVFGRVSSTYEILQNDEAFKFFDPIIESGNAFYESAGALRHGQRVWVMVRLEQDARIVEGDNIARFLLLSNTHDGSEAIQVKFTPVRVVCKNTLNLALDNGRALRVAHRPALHSRLKDVAITLDEILTGYSRIVSNFRRLAEVVVTDHELSDYLKRVFPDPSKDAEPKLYKRAMEQVLRDRAESARLFREGTGNDMPRVAATLWAAYNGVTEYIDFHRHPAGGKSWLDSVWFGPGAKIKSRALVSALNLTAMREVAVSLVQ
jgi:phage/plasmid-like protein (TIGR03299 family)